MKLAIILPKNYKMLCLILSAFFVQSIAWAQDKKVEVDLNINKGNDDWYRQPWVWVVGGAVFILLFVAIIRGGKKS